MSEPFDPERALERMAALATEAASGVDYAAALERIAEAFAAATADGSSVALRELLEALGRLTEQASLTAHLDDVTGLPNRRGFDDAMRRELERSYRGGKPLSSLTVAIDHFDRIGDADATDRALRHVADVLRRTLRHLDVASRVGPSTFRVLLPTASLEDAREVAERCRCALAAAFLPELGALTATFGVATLPDHAANSPGLLQAADAALSVGIRRGRNCVATALPLGERG